MKQTSSALDKNQFIISSDLVFVLQKNISEPVQFFPMRYKISENEIQSLSIKCRFASG